MSNTDERVDAYIANSAEFARPLLLELRARVHAALPQATETIKWSMPFFELDGRPLCNMAAFKQHVSFGFWNHAQVFAGAPREGMGSYGKMEAVGDLPAKKDMLADLKHAAALIASGAAKPRVPKKAAPKPGLETPADLLAALKKSKPARATFEAFSPSCRREYVEWIVEAKREETRARRIAEAVQLMAEGKKRYWKYGK